MKHEQIDMSIKVNTTFLSEASTLEGNKFREIAAPILRLDYGLQSYDIKLETMTSERTPKFKDHQIFPKKHQIIKIHTCISCVCYVR